MKQQCNLTEEKRAELISFLLGELSGSLAQEMDAHIAECDECSREVVEIKEVLGLLAFSGSMVSPPQKVKQRLMQRISSESTSRVVKFPEKSRLSSSRVWQVAAGLLLVVAAAEAFYISNLRGRLGDALSRLAQEQQAVTALSNQLVESREQLVKNRERIAAMTASSRLVVMDGKQANASGRAFWDTKHNTWLFYIENLPPAPEGKTYQLWFIVDKKPISSGIFKTDEKGRAELYVKMPVNTEPNKPGLATAVSLEPEGGSQQPRGAIYLLGSI